jgi:hypothetical protein
MDGKTLVRSAVAARERRSILPTAGLWGRSKCVGDKPDSLRGLHETGKIGSTGRNLCNDRSRYVHLRSHRARAKPKYSQICTCLQPVSIRNPTVRLKFRNSAGSTGSGFCRRPRACALERLKPPDSGRSAACPSECRNRSSGNAGRAYALRQDNLAGQKPSLRVLPHAVRRLKRTDPLG